MMNIAYLGSAMRQKRLENVFMRSLEGFSKNISVSINTVRYILATLLRTRSKMLKIENNW
jgi:hypothetical protein